MAGVLVIAEQRAGKLNRTSWEAIVAAQQIGGDITVLVPGTQTSAVANLPVTSDENVTLDKWRETADQPISDRSIRLLMGLR